MTLWSISGPLGKSFFLFSRQPPSHRMHRCIFMELYIKYPIFQGKTELDQCDVIFRVCGSPSPESWPGSTSLPWSDLIKFEPSPRRIRTSFRYPIRISFYYNILSCQSRFNLSDMCLDLTERMLQLDPARRPNIKGVLDHPFWSEDPPACQPAECVLFGQLKYLRS